MGKKEKEWWSDGVMVNKEHPILQYSNTPSSREGI